MIDEDALVLMAAEARAMLFASGLGARTVSRTETLERAMLEIRDRANHPVLSTDYHDFGAEDAFGILLEGGGALVGGMACRQVRLGRTTLLEHLEASNRRFYGEGSVTTKGSVVQELSGTLTYQGELFLAEEWRGGRTPVSAVMHLAHGLCSLKWQADWHFAFMPVPILHKAPAWGFHHMQLCTQRYDKAIPLRSSRECLVYCSRRDVSERAQDIARDPGLLQALSVKSNS